MKYKFPHLNHIDEVKSAIDGVEGFIVAERDWGTVINYVQMGNQTFPEVIDVPTAIRRECRGLIFDKNGFLVSRPLHKFFNLGERTETLVENVDISQPHVILEKLDGSMIRPFPTADGYRLGTKMGITDVAMQAELWLADNDNYDEFIQLHLDRGQTPIFEWCSRKQRIVIDYPQDRLVLIAIRDINSGIYKSYNQMLTYAEAYNVDVVRAYPGTIENMELFISETRDLKGQEGWVIRFEDGHMTKLKASEYLTIHKAKDNILRENGVITMLLDEKSDDIKPFLIDDDRKKVENYETAFWAGINNTVNSWKSQNIAIHNKYRIDQRKDFALGDATTLQKNLKSAIFKMWETDPHEVDWFDIVVNVVRLNINTGAKLEAIRDLWGSTRWNEQPDE